MLPGECIEITRSTSRKKLYWNPQEISKTDIIENPEEAAELLNSTINDCTAAWASCYNKIIHRLSGGLDSSIILSCLADINSPPDITCLNSFTASPDGDERIYARMAAAHAGVPLVEHEQKKSNVDLEQLLNIRRTTSPEYSLFSLDRSQCETELARTTGAEAIFSGAGGDGILFQPKTLFGASDYVRSHGIRPSLLGIAMDVARLKNKSIWSVLKNSIQEGLFEKPKNPFCDMYNEETSILNPEIMDTLKSEDILPHWLSNIDGVPSGKMLHISIATIAPFYYELTLEDAPFLEPVNPLCSQPIIELCLKIPTWTLTTGGKDRGLARMAFSKQAVSEIIRRESKGTNTDHFKDVFRDNIDFIRDFLLNGILVKQNLLHAKNLERILSGDITYINAEQVNILCHVTTEAWLRRCQG